MTGLRISFAECIGGGFEGKFILRAGLGAAEVGHEDGFAAAIDNGFDGRNRPANPAVVGDVQLFIQRHIKIDAHQHALSFDVHLGHSLLCHR